MAQPTLTTTTCGKCGRRLPRPAIPPALCSKCELIDALLVERYTHYEHVDEPDE